jgi:hypothetical protein
VGSLWKNAHVNLLKRKQELQKIQLGKCQIHTNYPNFTYTADCQVAQTDTLLADDESSSID